jgi:hypothetical protein
MTVNEYERNTMANPSLFRSLRGMLTRTDTVNEAGGPAFAITPKQALAQYAATGCLNRTFYASAEAQLDRVLELVSTTVVMCRDTAALITAALLRRNTRTEVIPFSDDVVRVDLNRRDSVMTNAQKLASLPSGGTNCSAPLRWLNRKKSRADLVILVSDNQSWVDSSAVEHRTVSHFSSSPLKSMTVPPHRGTPLP